MCTVSVCVLCNFSRLKRRRLVGGKTQRPATWTVPRPLCTPPRRRAMRPAAALADTVRRRACGVANLFSSPTTCLEVSFERFRKTPRESRLLRENPVCARLLHTPQSAKHNKSRTMQTATKMQQVNRPLQARPAAARPALCRGRIVRMRAQEVEVTTTTGVVSDGIVIAFSRAVSALHEPISEQAIAVLGGLVLRYSRAVAVP